MLARVSITGSTETASGGLIKDTHSHGDITSQASPNIIYHLINVHCKASLLRTGYEGTIAPTRTATTIATTEQLLAHQNTLLAE